ncbi:glycosyltransferase family 2 protein [Oryzobacter terrae]|uniref:glycosyltransferase family 2 protein n=1 Tax=Oryzobacter terrae TaxID=1620385 RepID=UPI00366B9E4E
MTTHRGDDLVTDGRTDDLRIAAIVPCHDEEAAVGRVVADLRAAVPGIEVFVYDNCSTDGTVEAALSAGAEVRTEPVKGKGNVIRRALADIDADVYVMVDGDDTYDAAAAPEMVRVLLSGPYDQVTGVRTPSDRSAYRSGHEMGNRMFNRVVSRIFGYPVNDMLSGYRVFSRRFVKSFPAISRAFEIETELTVHAINNRVPQAEVPVGFKDRPEGSASKLRTYHDGIRIARMITRLLHHERPMALYSTIAALTTLAAVGLGIPVIDEYLRTGLVGRFPTAFLAASLVVVAFIVLVVGILLDGLRKIRQENTRIAYMAIAPPPRRDGPGTPGAPKEPPAAARTRPGSSRAGDDTVRDGSRSDVPVAERSSERV